MKKIIRKIVTVAGVLAVSLFSVGCSGMCAYNCYNKAGDCAEQSWDLVGCYFNCFKENNCIPSCVYQSYSYQEFCINCFYGCGDECKRDCRNKGLNALMEDLEPLNKEDYNIEVDYYVRDTGGKYYYIELTYAFTAYKDVKDVIIGSSVQDNKYYFPGENNSASVYIVVGEKVKAGQTVIKTRTVTFAHTSDNTPEIYITTKAHGRY